MPWKVWNGLRASPPRGSIKRRLLPVAVTPAPFANAYLASRLRLPRRSKSLLRDMSVLRRRKWTAEEQDRHGVLEPRFCYSFSRRRGQLPSHVYS